MEVIERLTLEAAQADTMIACEHRHRYEFARRFCAGLRVVDLCCGSGYGSAILAERAREVLGVDNDAATIDLARASLGRDLTNTRFEAGDALACLRGLGPDDFDLLVCFEGLEHLPDLGGAIERLRELAGAGARQILSVPNSRAFGEENPFHLTDFGYDEAIATFAGFPPVVMLPQFLAEGSLISPPRPTGTDVKVSIGDRNEPQYAHHFIFCVNFDAAETETVLDGNLQLSAAPIFNRWSQETKLALAALRRENARLARARLGRADSAAGSTLARIADRELELAAWEERCRIAEARVRQLEAALSQRP